MTKETEHLELNKNKWDRRSETYDDKRFSYFRFFQKRVVNRAGLKSGQRFLDIGCGTGWAVRYAAGLVGEKGEACGIDISPGMLERAQANAKELKNVRFIQADSESLPFAENYFDAIICTNSFHHYLHPQKVLEEVQRVLKPGGRIYIVDPTADSCIVKMVDRRVMSREASHVKLYSTREFRELFTGAGLKYIRAETILPIMKIHIAEK